MRIILNSCLIALGTNKAFAACGDDDIMPGKVLSSFASKHKLKEKVVFVGPLEHISNFHDHRQMNVPPRVCIHKDGEWVLYRNEPGDEKMAQNIRRKVREIKELGKEITINGEKYRLEPERPLFNTCEFDPEQHASGFLDQNRILVQKWLPYNNSRGKLRKCREHLVWVYLEDKIQFRRRATLGTWWMVEETTDGQKYNWPVVEDLEVWKAERLANYQGEVLCKQAEKNAIAAVESNEDYPLEQTMKKKKVAGMKRGWITIHKLDFVLKTEKWKDYEGIELPSYAGRRRVRRRRLLESLYR